MNTPAADARALPPHRRTRWTLLALLGVAAGSLLAYQLLRAPPPAPGFAYGSGHVEATEVRLAAEVGGRVVSQNLLEGKRVRAGDVLVLIDPLTSRDQLASVQDEATALRLARSALDAQIGTWTHHLATTREQRARIEKLVAAKVASRQSLDSAMDAVTQAEGELGRLTSQRSALDAQIGSAAARVRLAETNVTRSEVRAPQDSTVLVRAVEAGEVIQAGQPLALLADLERVELKVYLAANDAGKVVLGQPARVRVDAFPAEYFEARVARVDAFAQFTPRDIHVPDERAQMVYGVTLEIANGGQRLKPGMPADAWIRWDDGAPWPERLDVPRG